MTVTTTGELYAKAMSATRAYLDAVQAEQWQNATPCTEWKVRDIANHIIGENDCLDRHGGLCRDGDALQRAPFNPGAVVHPHSRIAEQIPEH
jgi:hypothetical protein